MGKDSQSTATMVDRALGLAGLVSSTLLPEQLAQQPQGGVQAAQGSTPASTVTRQWSEENGLFR